MLGIHELPVSAATKAAAGRRGATRTLLALATAAAAFIVVAGTAQAQDCVGGYRMLKGEIPVACDGGLGQPAYNAAPLDEPLYTGSINEEPLYTGSINSVPPAAARIEEPAATVSSSGQECEGGYSYRETAANGWTLPMRCN